MDDCQLQYTVVTTYEYFKKTSHWTSEVQLDLAKVEPVQEDLPLEYNDGRGHSYREIFIAFSTKAQGIHFRESSSDKIKPPWRDETVTRSVLIEPGFHALLLSRPGVSSNEMVPRMLKALGHAASLCRARNSSPEPF